VSNEDATRILTRMSHVRKKSCVSCSWSLENDTTHGQMGAALQRSRPPADQSGKRVASWMGKSPDTPFLLRHLREDATRKTVPWNLSLTISKCEYATMNYTIIHSVWSAQECYNCKRLHCYSVVFILNLKDRSYSSHGAQPV